MIESVILGRLVNDRDYASKVLPHLKPEFFSEPGAKDTFSLIKSYSTKYKVPPTQEALVVMLTESSMEENRYNDCLTAIEGMSFDETTDRKWLTDQTENWARNTAVEQAVMRAIGIIDSEKTGNPVRGETLDKNGIPKLLQEALAVSFDNSLGRNYLESAEKQWEYYSAPDQRYPFTVQTLNRITKGGTKNKTLNIVFGGINCFVAGEEIEVYVPDDFDVGLFQVR